MSGALLDDEIQVTVEEFLTPNQDDFQNMVRDPQLFEDYVIYTMWQHEDGPGEVHYDGNGKVPGIPRTHIGPNNVDAFIERLPYRVSFSSSDRGDIEGEAPQVNIDRLSEDPRGEVEKIAEELGLREYHGDTYIVLDDGTGVAYLTVNSHSPEDTIRVEGTGLPDGSSKKFRYSDELNEVITRI